MNLRRGRAHRAPYGVISVDEVAAHEAPAVASVLSAAFEPLRPLYTDAAFDATTPSAEALAARWHEGATWLARLQGRAVGTVGAVLGTDDVYVRSMAVVPEAQGRGVGAALLTAALDFATLHHAPAMTLWTTPFLEAALALYQRHGFQRTGTGDLHGVPLIGMRRILPVTRLVVYGSLQPGGRHHELVSDIAGNWRQGWITGTLENAGWAAERGYPRLRSSPTGGRVAAWMLESPELPLYWSRLDEFEGADYRRRPVPFSTALASTEAYCYIAP